MAKRKGTSPTFTHDSIMIPGRGFQMQIMQITNNIPPHKHPLQASSSPIPRIPKIHLIYVDQSHVFTSWNRV